jgi:hypothetical protein
MLNNGPDGAEDTENGGDISGAPFEAMKCRSFDLT